MTFCMEDLAVDDATINPYGGYEIEWSGMELLDFVLVPHFESDHPESEAVNGVVQYMKEHDILHRTLRDGDVIIKELKRF